MAKKKQIIVNISSPTDPIVLAKDFIRVDSGAYAVINGPSKVVWDPLSKNSYKIWIEIDDEVDVQIKKITKES